MVATKSSAPIRLRVGDRIGTPPQPGFCLVVSPSAHPLLSWIVPLLHDGQQQTAFEALPTFTSQPANAPRSGTVASSSRRRTTRCDGAAVR